MSGGRCAVTNGATAGIGGRNTQEQGDCSNES